MKYLKKNKISIEEGKEACEKEGIVLDLEEKKNDKRGRPKKEVKEVEVSKVVDLFAEMIDESMSMGMDMVNELEEAVVEEKGLEEEKSLKKEKVSKKEEKELNRLKKEEEKELKRIKKEEEKELKRVKKEEEKGLKKEKSVKKEEKNVEKEEEEEKKEEVKKVRVSLFEFEGKEYYLDSSSGVLYDPKTKEEIGIYCEKSKSIKELPEDSDSELEEEEYN
jgi:hypothetical protein